uniref:Uncharacterized protein n=1 Tax=Arundo donax TaxID=35708 RepID=A0A0A9F769_ARUDO
MTDQMAHKDHEEKSTSDMKSQSKQCLQQDAPPYWQQE